MRILHALSQRPEATGSGVYVQAMISAAHRKGHENFLLAGIPQGNSPAVSDIPREYCGFVRFDGGDLPFPVVGMSDVMPYPSIRFCDLTDDEVDRYEQCFIEKLQPIIRNFQPEIVHSHHLWLMSSAIKKRFPELPLVITCHGSDLRQIQNVPRFRSRVLQGCLPAEAVMALSVAQKQDIASLYGIAEEKIQVVGAGFNESLFCPAKKTEGTEIEIAYAGKLSRSKGVLWLLRALEQIPQTNWKLHLVGGGSGEDKTEILDFAERFGEKVHTYGAIPQTELADIFKRAHLFVLPSFYEGLPLVLLEALACGCRLISTKLPGIAEIFGDVSCAEIRLVDLPRLRSVDQPYAEDEADFVVRLTEALQYQLTEIEKEPQLDFQNVKLLIDRFTWPKIFEMVEKIYVEKVSDDMALTPFQRGPEWPDEK